MKFTCVALAALILIFTACSPRAAIRVNADNSGSVTFKMDSSAVMQSVLVNLGMIKEGSPLFNAAQIRTSLAQAGLVVTQLSFPTPTALDVTAAYPDARQLLAPDAGFIELKTDAGKNRLRLRVSPQTVQKAVTLMPPETAEYLELLIAPVFTGEVLSQTEYLELMGVAYGASAAKELQSASLSLTVTVPAAVKRVAVSHPDAATAGFAANTATFKLPLAAFLTDLRTTDYEIEW